LGRISDSHLLPWETLVTAQLWEDSADIESSCQEKNNRQVNRAGKMSEPRGWRIHAGRDRYMACWAMYAGLGATIPACLLTGSHGKVFWPWVLDWERQKPTAQQSCRGYPLRSARINPCPFAANGG